MVKCECISKMKITILFSVIISLCISFSYSNAQSMSPKKILIVYLSRTNNTKAIAEMIHKNVGGTLVALELKNPSRKLSGYSATSSEGK